MYDRILVPLDGSALAEMALPYAELLSGKLGSEVVLMCVRDAGDIASQRISQVYLERMVEATREGSRRVRQQPGVIEIKSAVQVGNPAWEIVEYARREKVDLIVMATHGRSGVKHWPLGNVAEKVARATDRPIMLIRANGAAGTVHGDGIMAKIIVPLDGSKEGEAALPYVEHLASKLGARVVLLQVLATGYIGLGYTYVGYTEQQIASDTVLAREYLDKIASRLRVSGIQTELVLRQGNAAEEIIDLAGETSAGIVAMSTHGRSGIGRWVYGSVAEKVLHGGTRPLLLVRAHSQDAVKSGR